MSTLASIPDALGALRAGRPVLVTDDEDRENEGDVILAAAATTQEWLAWTIRHTSGVVCAPMPLPDSTWSIEIENAVSHPALPGATIGGMSSRSRYSGAVGMHTSPRAQRNMKLTASGLTHSAAIVRSPSFSRSSSSATRTISPRRIRRRASSMLANFMW